MKNKKRLIIMISIVVLTIAVALFAILNAGNIEEKSESQEKAEVKITINEQEAAAFTLNDLKQYEKTSFNANLDTSEADAVEKSFGGVPLKDVLSGLDISLNDKDSIVFIAADGYQTVVSGQEALQDDNIYLVYEREGKPSGTKADGGTGPIEIVISKDEFSQRWCKFLMEIRIDESA